jgi:transcriptional regulator with XRE-family HTH domain
MSFPWICLLSVPGSGPANFSFRMPKSQGAPARRYGHYVRGMREPDYATLLRICEALGVTPNDLLLPVRSPRRLPRDGWLSRLLTAARRLDTEDVKLAVRQVEALLAHRESTQN